MYTRTRLEQVMLRPLSSPLELCRTLGLSPTGLQTELLADSAGLTRYCDWEMDRQGEILRTAAMLVLWRVLSREGSRALVLAPGTIRDYPSGLRTATCGPLGRDFMDWLGRACTFQDPGLSSITHRTTWNRIQFGGVAGWEVRMMPIVPGILAEEALSADTGLVIGAGSSDTDFLEAQKALEGGLRLDDVSTRLLLRLW